MMLNPIIEKDIKTKMRGWRMPILLSIYLLLLGLVLLLFFIANNQMFNNYGYSTFNPRIAVNAYNTLAICQFFLLVFIVPAITATVISGERERQTLDLMLCSGISTYSIIMGKLCVSISHVMLLVFASLPIMGMVFLFGGITFLEILTLFLYFLIIALMIASMGIFFSIMFKKSVMSIIATYISLGLIGLGPVIALAVWGIFYAQHQGTSPSYETMVAFMFASPGFGFSSFLSSGDRYGGSMISLLYEFNRMKLQSTSWLKNIEPWIINALFCMILSALLVWLGALKLNPVKRKKG